MSTISRFDPDREEKEKDPYVDLVGFPSPLRKDKRYIPQKTTKDVLMLLLLVPFWLSTVIVWGVAYQIISRILRMIGLLRTPPRPPLDAGVQVPETIKPRPDRKYDIVVLGVTGFTGRLAARHLAQQYFGDNKDEDSKVVKWAIAGRSQIKLDATKQSLADELKLPDLVEKIDTIVVDTMDATTLPALVQDTRVVATTAGPYQEYGNTVVEACAKYGTHYCDITGEIGWVKAMMVQWGETARKTGAKIVPFCGNDSIPWDLTVFKLNEMLYQTFEDDLQTVKIWDEAVMEAPGGTYATILVVLEGRAVKPPRCKVDPFLQLPTTSEKSTHTTTEDLPIFIDQFFNGRWTSPFVMAIINAKVVRWTHALRQQGAKKISYREVLIHRNWQTALHSILKDIMAGSLLLSSISRWLAYGVLGIMPKPGNGPSYENMEKTNYLLVTAEGLGTNGNRAESTLYFPKDPGCLETAKMMVESGLALAFSERKDEGTNTELISGNQGGFWSPAAALGQVLLDRLIKVGVEYESRTVAKPEPTEKEDENKTTDETNVKPEPEEEEDEKKTDEPNVKPEPEEKDEKKTDEPNTKKDKDV